ncbi:MAG: CopG family antitoxin [Blastocatellia bacterium]
MVGNNLSSISQANSLEKIGEFWDTHDFTDYDDPTLPDAEFTVSCSVVVERQLLNALQQQAGQHGLPVETLVHQWLREKLAEDRKAA